MVESNPDSTFSTADIGAQDLNKFFNRPIRIATYTWAVGTNIGVTFNPWINFFSNPRVINRITNYNLLRCKLCVKFLINGSPFHYGRLLASYTPKHNEDEFDNRRYPLIPEDLIAASQKPHLYLDPAISEGGCMQLPFVHETNALSIPASEWETMGEFDLWSFQTLRHANEANDPVTISVFAWAEEINLSVLTNLDPATLSPQSGDEYVGSISKPANIVSKIAGRLTDAPIIGPYALATQMAASAISNVAKVFGYSRPRTTDSSSLYLNRPYSNMTNSDAIDTSEKISFDPKQEITVDSRVVGLAGKDEMSIASIATRESYLTTFPWDGTSPVESSLFQIKVDPLLYVSRLGPNFSEKHMTPMCFATLPFRYWRGSIRYRFQIICSAYHKGRLKFVYEPTGVNTTTTEYNTNYTEIIDISDNKDFTIEIGWGQRRSFEPIGDIISDDQPFSNTNFVTPGSNGTFGVYVVNTLTAPSTVTLPSISINVIVSAGDDFEVVDTSDDFELLSVFQPQSGVDEIGSEETKPTSDANLPTALDSLRNLSETDQTYHVYFGDPLVSFRQVLKRYSLHGIVVPDDVLTESYYIENFPIFPEYRGYTTLPSKHTTLNDINYNYNRMTLLNYISSAYIARRGSIRWKYAQINPGRSDISGDYMAVSRLETDTPFVLEPTHEALIGLTASGNPVNQSGRVDQYLRILPDTHLGSIHSNPNLNPVIEVEFPDYNFRRFHYSRKRSTVRQGQRLTWITRNTGTHSPSIVKYVSVGEDFSLAFFLSVPVMFVYVDPPPKI